MKYCGKKLFEYELEFFFLCFYVLFRPFGIIFDTSSSPGAKFLGCIIIFLMLFLIFEVCFLSSVFWAKMTFLIFTLIVFPLVSFGVLTGQITQSLSYGASFISEGMMLMCMLYRTYLRLKLKLKRRGS